MSLYNIYPAHHAYPLILNVTPRSLSPYVTRWERESRLSIAIGQCITGLIPKDSRETLVTFNTTAAAWDWDG